MRYTNTPKTSLKGLNAELVKIEDAFKDVLDRKDEEANFMDTDLDMNSHRILNLPSPVLDQEPLRKGDAFPFYDQTESFRDEAVQAAEAAQASASSAQGALDELLATVTTQDLINGSMPSLEVGSTITTTGFYTAGDGGGALWVKTASTDTPSQTPADMGDATISDALGSVWSYAGVMGTSRREIHAASLGAMFVGGDDRQEIQSTINAASQVSGVAILPPGETILSIAGQLNSFNYCLKILDGVKLVGAGRNKTKLKVLTGDDSTIIMNDRYSNDSLIEFEGFSVDGNYPAQTGSGIGFGIWLYNVSSVTMRDVSSLRCVDFGFRLQFIDSLNFGDILSDQGEAVTSDGFHLIDCNNVTGSNVRVTTRGDDGFVIEAAERDVHDISISNLVIDTPVTGEGAGKGLYIVNNTANGSSGTSRKIYNVSMPNVVTFNCAATALSLERAEFENIDVCITDRDSFRSFGVLLGDNLGVGVSGYLINSSIKVVSINPTTQSALITEVNGFVDGCEFDILSSNPGEGSPGASIIASNSSIKARVNYNPNGDKVSLAQCLIVKGDDNDLSCSVRGGSSNLRLDGSNNTISIKSKDSGTRDVEILDGANDNFFTSGSVTTSVLDSGIGNKFFAIKGMCNKGSLSATTNGSGNVVLPHGLIKTPNAVFCSVLGDNNYDCGVQAVNNINVTFRVRDTSNNSDVTNTAVTIMYDLSA